MIRKLDVDFSSTIQNKEFIDRKYTLTHSDTTGQRYLFIGEQFAEDRFNNLRDEVLGEWTRNELHIICNLYSEYSSLTLEKRYEKFKEHMPRAITAILNGDKEYIIKKNLLDYKVLVSFLSNKLAYKEYYGKIQDYII